MRAEQGTDQWFLDRLGHLTASRMVDAMAGKTTAARKNYIAQLVAERLTGNKSESFTSSAMEWGVSNEPLARAEYEILTGQFVDQDGFIKHPNIEWCGASCDGFVGTDGLIEIKAPNTATHIEYLLAGEPPARYVPQMALQLICTGREWCDFVSYDCRLPEEMRLFVVRYEPTAAYIKSIEDQAREFLSEVESCIKSLKEVSYGKAA